MYYKLFLKSFTITCDLLNFVASSRYPIYQRGNPQLRIFLPNFWMKLVHPDYKQPENIVKFIVSVEMTDHDIKNYLEKIYKVPVAKVQSSIETGLCQLLYSTGKFKSLARLLLFHLLYTQLQ